MTDVEVAWVAGLLEGEGSFLVLNRHQNTVQCPRVSIGMTDKDVLDKLAAIVSVGTVRAVRNSPGRLGKKPLWQWSVTRRAEIQQLCEAVYPWLGERRREQVDLVLATFGGVTIVPEGVCRRGHALTPANRLSRYGAPTGPCKTCFYASPSRARKAQHPASSA